MSSPEHYVIGIDYGTLSGRAVVVRVGDGAELASAVHEYRHGVLEESLDVGETRGAALPPDWALQVPHDYVDVLQNAVPAAVRESGIDPDDVIGIGTDFTACTVLPVLDDGTPLCEVPELATRPHAYVKLWKHHAAQAHADRINTLAAERGEPWLGRYGGRISSEWEFAKGLQLLEEDPEIYQRTVHWIEAADWIVWQLSGVYVRNACTAGYKAILQDGAYPSREFLAALNPDFADFVVDKVERPIARLGDRVGSLTPEAARWTGLPVGIAVCTGNVDAHVTAPAAQAIEPGQMVAIMGTSTCHVMSSDMLHEVPGMCGVVDGGIVPGLWGYEAGQSGVGDIFAWYVERQVPASYAQRRSRCRAERPRAPHAARGRHPGRGTWTRGARLAQREPLGARRSRAVRRRRRADAGDQTGGDLPRPARGDRVRDAQDRRVVRGTRRSRRRVHRRRRSPEEPVPDAALRRRHRPADRRHRFRSGAGARLGDPCRGRGRRVSRHPGRGDGDGTGRARACTSPTSGVARSTTGCTPSTRHCTTTSGAARPTSCTACARSSGRPNDERANYGRGASPICVRRSARCTASSSAGDSSRGRAAT